MASLLLKRPIHIHTVFSQVISDFLIYVDILQCLTKVAQSIIEIYKPIKHPVQVTLCFIPFLSS